MRLFVGDLVKSRTRSARSRSLDERVRGCAGAANGLKLERFDVTLDDTTVTVKLRAEIKGVPAAPAPPVFKTADRVPPVPRPAS